MVAKTWTALAGNDSAPWNTAADWTGDVLPASGDSVFINQALSGPYTVTLTSNEAVAALSVAAGNATLELGYAGFTLSVAGRTTLSAGAIVVNGAATLQTGSLFLSGGALSQSDGTIAVAGKTSLSAGNAAFFGGQFTAGSVDMSGGTLTQSGGTIAVDGKASLSAGNAAFFGGQFTAGSIDVTGGTLGASGGVISSLGATKLSGTGTIGLYNSAATLHVGSLSVSAGLLGVAAGTISSETATKVLGTGTIALYGSTATLQTESLSVTDGGTLSQSAGTISVRSLASLTGGTSTFYGGVLHAGSLRIGTNDLAATAVLINGADVTVDFVTTISSANTVGGSRINLAGGSLTSGDGIRFGGTTNFGTLFGHGQVNGGTISGYGTIEANGGILDITNNIASGPVLVIDSGSTLKIDGAVAGTFSQVPLLIDPTQTLEIGSSGALKVATLLQATAGTIRLDGGSITDPAGIQTGAYVTITGFGTIHADLLGYGTNGATLNAAGGVLTVRGNLSSALHPQIESASHLALQGTVDVGTIVTFLDASSGTLDFLNAATRKSFESNGIISGMKVGAVATTVLDMHDILPESITSGAIINGNTIQLYNGTKAIDHFTLDTSPGAAFVKWASDGTGGTDIFLSSVA